MLTKIFIFVGLTNIFKKLLMDERNLKKLIENAWEDRHLIEFKEYHEAIEMIIQKLDRGEVRVAEPIGSRWHVNEWIKKAIILYFPIKNPELIHHAPFVYHDKVRLKTDYKEKNVRVVPGASVRYGTFLASGTFLMPSHVNIGAYIDTGSLIGTWASVGYCTQLGKQVYISRGVKIGGYLEPLTDMPVIIEDHAYLGAGCTIVDGVLIGEEAVLGENVSLNASTKIIDITQSEPVEYKKQVPKRAIVIPGAYQKRFPAGEYQVPCAFIVGYRPESADKKASLEEAFAIYHRSL